ncbi:hypothetical protein [Campylobacter iguaniorum]|nr:hypothetical protein [Campylobacter iguaniorum]
MNDEIVNEVLEILTSKKYNNLNLEDLHILQVAGDNPRRTCSYNYRS